MKDSGLTVELRSFHNNMVIFSCLWVVWLLWGPPILLLLILKADALNRAPLAVLALLGFLSVGIGLGGFPLGLAERALFYGACLISAGLLAAKTPLRGSLPRKTTRRAAFLVCSALLLIAADYLFILGAQGWEWETGRWFSASYFRGAFLTDAERNHILVQSILRGTGSPFLPEFPLRFQLLPFELLAFFTSSGEPLSRFSEVQGITAAFGLTLFLLILLWAIRTRPRWLKRPALLLGVAVGVFSHADWVHLALSYWREGQLGIEADGSYGWFYFRYFSLKLMTLLSPHHTLFCIFALGFFWVRRFLQGSAREIASLAMGATAAAISPPLAGVLFPLLAVAEMASRGPARFKFWLAFGVSALILTWATLGFAPWEFLNRVSLRQWTWGLSSHWRLFPFALFGSLGWLGLWLTWGLLRRDSYRRVNREFPIFILGAFAVAYLAGEGAEVQRHVSLLGSFVGALWIWRLLADSSPKIQNVLAASLLLAVFANSVFVFRHTALPSVLDQGIAWQDYFRLNSTIRERLPNTPVVAAISESRGSFPIAMEATTSFSMPMDVYIYHSIPETLVHWLQKSASEYLIVPYAEALGYRYIVWGPAEQRAWGSRVRERFVGEDEVFRAGSVALYPLRDRFKTSGSAPAAIAHRLFTDGWNQEAYDYYASLLKHAPGEPQYLEMMGRLWKRAGNQAQAKIFQEMSENIDGLAKNSTRPATQAKVKQ